MTDNNLPSFETLFGGLEFKKGDEGRTVYSPAAYLADLLQLMEDNFGENNEVFSQRRKDIFSETKLSTKNTFSQIPYLEIVNKILKDKIEGGGEEDAFELLKASKYPFNLPFNWENERFKKHLGFSGVEAVEFFKLFMIRDEFRSESEKNLLFALEYLGLSPEELECIIEEPGDVNAFLNAHFHLGLTEPISAPPAELVSVSSFLAITGLSAEELLDLLYGNLSETAKNSNGEEEASMANALFINNGMAGHARLDNQEENILWGPAVNADALNSDWFLRISRASRFIRMAKQTGISFIALDTILRTCCRNTLDEEAIKIIAIIKQIQDNYELPIDQVCAFIGNIDILGIGDEDAPVDLFNRAFNVKFAPISKTYIPLSEFIPKAYAGEDDPMEPLDLPADIMAEESREFRNRIQQALHISNKGLKLILEKFEAKYQGDESENSPFEDGQMGLQELSLLFRISKLVEAMDISYSEFFDLLDLLENDPSIREFAQFSILINNKAEELDCYKILTGYDEQSFEEERRKAEAAKGAPLTDAENQAVHDAVEAMIRSQIQASLWLVQTLGAVVRWMQSYDFTAEELKLILTGKHKTEKERAAAEKQKLGFLNNLYQQFKSVFFQEEHFVSGLFGERASRIFYKAVLEEKGSLVSEKDKRIVHFNEEAARAAAFRGLNQLPAIHQEDFLGLGIHEKMVDKIFDNLVFKGYIKTDGRLVEEAFPEKAEAFKINNNTVAEKEQVFEIFYQLFHIENGNGEMLHPGDGDDPENGEPEEEALVDMQFFYSDLEEIPVDEARKKELYDNLIFNGYIDEEGNVLDPLFFSHKENQEKFEVNARIDAYSEKIHSIISANIQAFERAKLKLDKEIFSGIPFKEIELEDLVENLRFNEYITEDGYFKEKNKILKTDVRDFNLSLMFYPFRHQILAAIKQAISRLKDRYYVVTKAMLEEAADEIVAGLVYDSLKDEYFPNGAATGEEHSFFIDRDNLSRFEIGPYFNGIYTQAVFDAIGQFLESGRQYQLNAISLQPLELDEESIEDLMLDLHTRGFIDEQGSIPESQLPFFLNINNALLFEMEGFEDYNKDIFFILNAAAREIEAGVDEIVTQLRNLWEAQKNIVYASLQEFLELPAELVEVLCGHIFRDPPNIVEEVIVPVLKSVDEDEQILKSPDDNKFNFALKRMKQFAFLALKLGMDEKAADVVFEDQELVEKFPERLAMPEEIDSFGLLLDWEVDASEIEGLDEKGRIPAIYMFKGNQYWVYDAKNYNLLASALSLKNISESFANLTHIDAAFKDEKENIWIISGTQYFCKAKDDDKWQRREKAWGKVESNFSDPERIDASFVDNEGKAYLFSGDQYIRYSGDISNVDPGFPKTIQGNWKNELEFGLPARYHKSIDAAFQSPDNTTYIFKDHKFISSEDPTKEIDINQFWGKVKNNFAVAEKIDACFTIDQYLFVFAGDQLMIFSNSIENEELYADDGTLTTLKTWELDLPQDLDYGLDAAFLGFDKFLYLFKDGQYCPVNTEDTPDNPELIPITRQWGILKNNILSDGKVDAAFTGLDGRTYLFSGDQYYRYSWSNYSKVDEGYPKAIAEDWAGLTTVDAAFVLDGKTYLFGKKTEEEEASSFYIRYSTNDYSEHDEEYPKEANDNWWNLPNALVAAGFSTPDAVFVGTDKAVHLFKGGQFISFDANHRWWSEPRLLADKWDSIPFASVAAAFTGKDGKTYVFSAEPMSAQEGEGNIVENDVPLFQYIRYSDKAYNKIDDRYPKVISDFWGNVANNIQRYKKVDAALTLVSTEKEEDENGEEQEVKRNHTYLFSGNQFFRYTDRGNGYSNVDEGYPKTIKTSLKEEPRFKNMELELESGIDAAFADQRNVYLIKGGQVHIISEEKYRNYSNGLEMPLRAAFFEDGKVYAESQGQQERPGWFRLTSLEGADISTDPAEPALFRAVAEEFRNVPEHFKQGLDAVLKGSDGNLYLFKDGDCFNGLLEKTYPINEEWGRVKNNIFIDNRIDAAFVGRDGKTYLFRRDQFVCYEAPEGGSMALPEFVKGNPEPIAKHWGGLANVHIAYVRDDKTYLLEKPDEEGRFRYICCESDDYSTIGNYPIQTADFSWWGIPAAYVEEGFTQVDTVLIEDEHMFLIKGKNFIQYNGEEKLWTYERPLERIWKGIPFNDANFKSVITAFTGVDGLIYFFSEEAFVSYEKNLPENPFGEIKEIRVHWAKVDNNIVGNNKVDAAFVYGHETTYLFSGGQFVRYSTSDYRFVDEGYPKIISESLRKEDAFKNLPAEFDSLMETGAPEERRIDSIISNKGNIYIFENTNCHVLSQSLNRAYPIESIGKIRNAIEKYNRIDAAYLNDNGDTILFCGDQFFKYADSNYEYVDEGYPKLIAENLSAEENIGIFSSHFNYDIDAALKTRDGNTFLFKGEQFYSSENGGQEGTVAETFGKIDNVFFTGASNTGESPNIEIDAAFTGPDGYLYIFKEGQFLRYSRMENEYADEGYPMPIKDNWGNLPVNYESGFDSAFTFEGKTYFVKGDEYVRFSDKYYRRIDSIYPQKFTSRWSDWNDFLLNDLRNISKYLRLNEQHTGADYTLTDFFYSGDGYKKEPYKMLSELFGWAVEEVKFVKRNNAFLEAENQFEVDFNIELVNKMYDIFRVSNKIGAGPSEIFPEVWENRYLNNRTGLAAEALYIYLGLNNSEKNWKILSAQIRDELNLLQRGHLMPFLIAIDDEVENARDLFNKLLIDVEMGSEGMTSVIKEAISAIQLYFHRYFVNLEKPTVEGESEAATKAHLKSLWSWMQNYRVWEANRKVFLYPENYIRPELRDTKTPDFKTLEDDLLQGDMTDGRVERAYKKYLDAYTEVSRLRIAGGYSYFFPKSPHTKQLIFFGQTRSHPKRYFYRTAYFEEGSTRDAHWNPWLEVNIKIDVDRVYPVYAFGRMFVFWVKAESVSEEKESDTAVLNVTQTDDNNQTVKSANSSKKNVIRIYFSYYNLNKEWAPIQVLSAQGERDEPNEEITLEHKGALSDIQLHVENSNKIGDFDSENIVIKCTYKESVVSGIESISFVTDPDTGMIIDFELKYAYTDQGRNRAFHLKPELVADPIPDATFPESGIDEFLEIFHDGENVSPDTIIPLNTFENSPDGPWFSFVHKGGSFLAKPAVDSLGADHYLRALANQTDFPIPREPVDAAFKGLDGNNYFFQNQVGDDKVNQYLIIPGLGFDDSVVPQSDLRWGLPDSKLERVTAIFRDDSAGKFHFFDGSTVYTYSNNQLEFTDKDNPKTVADSINASRFPKDWASLDAWFRNAAGKGFFFDGAKFVTTDNLELELDINARWGKARNTITDPDSATPVIGAFVSGSDAFLISHSNAGSENSEIFKYSGSEYRVAEAGFPIANSVLGLLQELGVSNAPNDIGPDERVTAAFNIIPESFDLLAAPSLSGLEIYLETSAGGKWIINGSAITEAEDSRSFETEFLERIDTNFFFIFGDVDFDLNTGINGDIQSGFIGGDFVLYLFFGTSSKQIPLSGTVIDPDFQGSSISIAGEVHPIVSKWGLELNPFTESNARVDAAFYEEREGKTYLFSGGQYLVYSNSNLVNGDYGLADPSYPKALSNSNEPLFQLPAFSKMDAVFKAIDGKVHFFSDSQFVESTVNTSNGRWALSAAQSVNLRWGFVANTILEQGVQAAFVHDAKIYLIGVGEYVRYIPDPSDGSIPETIDTGQPIKLSSGLSKQIDAVFTLEDGESDEENPKENIYLFSGDQYAKIENGDGLNTVTDAHFKSIKDNWGNMLPEIKKNGLNAALNTESILYLFQGGAFVKYDMIPEDNSIPVLPYELEEAQYDIIRLTTNTAYKLNQALFEGGVEGLLNREIQEIDETPGFEPFDASENPVDPADPNVVVVKKDRVHHYPTSSYLDFNSANGIYYWEIFFHAPHLIAQAFNTNQCFEESKRWYEFIFDPTEVADYWKFLPFLSVDVEAIVNSGREKLEAVAGLFTDEADAATQDALQADLATLHAVFDGLEPFIPFFTAEKSMIDADKEALKDIDTKAAGNILKEQKGLLENADVKDEETIEVIESLEELMGIIGQLPGQYDLMQTSSAQIDAFLKDPFDPHAIATLRRIAYRRAIVMAYIDNLIDWGDMLFRQYTVESINEARMLYILAYDLLGQKPESMGNLILSDDKAFEQLDAGIGGIDDMDFLLELEDAEEDIAGNESPKPVTELTEQGPVNIHDSVLNPYFFIPENELFLEYWGRVEDRLYKIRQSLNILGVKQPLPLFQPPIDPMAIVQAVGSGAGVRQAIAVMKAAVPEYRFSFLIQKAKELVQKLNEFGGELLATLEKKDAEELNMMYAENEGVILSNMMKVREAHLEEAEYNIESLKWSKKNADDRVQKYSAYLDAGKLPTEHAQIAMMSLGAAMMLSSSIIKLASGLAHLFPNSNLGLFILGVTHGGKNVGDALDKFGEALETGGDGISMAGEALGIEAQFQRMQQEWELQKLLAESDALQIDAQIKGAEIQKSIAQYEISNLEREISQNESIRTFMKQKFTNQQLYQWMASQLSGLYFQAYQIAFDMAKSAERAYQYERGAKESDVHFIHSTYWDSQRKGLLAGQRLGLGLDRMEQAFIQSGGRRLEISKNISMLELDPIAFLELKTKGVCEFSLSEALFDYDFQGHYCRQIKTISLSFDAAEGETVNATLTQLNHKTILEPDPKAVKFLLQPKDKMPLSIRADWKANRQIVLSHVDEFEKGNGMFELRLDDERYLPFEGAGAVSTWRLELNGKKGSYNLKDVLDVVVNIKYTALQGGEKFANAVKGLLKPYQASRYFDLLFDFPDEWNAFLESDSDEFTLAFTRGLFPNMSSSKIAGIFTKYDLYEDGQASMALNNNEEFIMQDGKLLLTEGLSIGSRGSDFTFKVEGDKRNIKNVEMVFSYMAKV
ncbi:MAG: hypothetical protein J5I94_12325 [Phaeodactylibacter sp.]|nr:hypothetical protein [Phaeodactylibacter sp.]